MAQIYNARPIPGQQAPRHRRHIWAKLITSLIMLTALYTGYAVARPVESLTPTIIPPVMPAQLKVAMPWPTSGQAAIGANGYGLLEYTDDQLPTPTASITKVVTALLVLEKKPLALDEPGPAISISAQDVSSYYDYVARDGAVVPVSEGETVTEYQALQAMLLASANNMADTLAIWAYGSMEAYTTAANTYVRQHHLLQTTITDASGFAPATVSTPADLVRLGDIALDHPVINQIVGQRQAEFPGVGTIYSVNSLLGESGIRGIKTGNTPEAGGCYLAAADIVVDGKTVTVITAIMGSETRTRAMGDSVPLIQSAAQQFRTVNVLKADQVVGHVDAPWGASSDIIAEKEVSALAWMGTALAPDVEQASITTPAIAATHSGRLILDFNGDRLVSDLRTRQAIAAPSLWWRLSHPL